MRYFRDSITQELFAFEDDVEAKQKKDGAWEFYAGGERLPGPYPATLTPTEDSTPPAVAPAPEQLKAQRDTLLQIATLRIAPLQDAADLGTATADEAAKLKSWKEYRVAVNRTDLTATPVTWPTPPEALSS